MAQRGLVEGLGSSVTMVAALSTEGGLKKAGEDWANRPKSTTPESPTFSRGRSYQVLIGEVPGVVVVRSVGFEVGTHSQRTSMLTWCKTSSLWAISRMALILFYFIG
jgi:hypothetical protein